LAHAVSARLSKPYSAADGRKFGLTVGGVFLVLAVLARWRGHAVSSPIFAIAAILLIVAGVVIPAGLRQVDRAWMALAHLISKVTTPLFMGLIYFVILTPIGLVRRIGGGNALVHKAGPTGFWADRSQAPASSLERQF
jgi:hypothetical protein